MCPSVCLDPTGQDFHKEWLGDPVSVNVEAGVSRYSMGLVLTPDNLDDLEDCRATNQEQEES